MFQHSLDPFVVRTPRWPSGLDVRLESGRSRVRIRGLSGLERLQNLGRFAVALGLTDRRETMS